MLYQDLGSVPDLPRPFSYFGRRHHAAEEMRANCLGEVCPAPWAQIRPAAEHVGAKLYHAEVEVA
jgi:hypothetical protein